MFLNLYFIGKYGYLAAAYTTVAGYFILMIFHLIAVRWVLKKKIYRDGLYFALLSITGVAGCLFLLVYRTVLLRYAIMAVFILVVLICKKDDLLVLLTVVKKRRGKE